MKNKKIVTSLLVFSTVLFGAASSFALAQDITTAPTLTTPNSGNPMQLTRPGGPNEGQGFNPGSGVNGNGPGLGQGQANKPTKPIKPTKPTKPTEPTEPIGNKPKEPTQPPKPTLNASDQAKKASVEAMNKAIDNGDYTAFQKAVAGNTKALAITQDQFNVVVQGRKIMKDAGFTVPEGGGNSQAPGEGNRPQIMPARPIKPSEPIKPTKPTRPINSN